MNSLAKTRLNIAYTHSTRNKFLAQGDGSCGDAIKKTKRNTVTLSGDDEVVVVERV